MLQNILDIWSEYNGEYIGGLITTLQISVISLIASLLLGTVIAIFCISPFRTLVIIGRAYIEFIRNTPLLIQIFFFYFGLPSLGIQLSAFIAGTLGLTVYTAAFISEAIRAGINSIPKGQMEAARASGLTYIQAMRYVVLPQAFKIVIPPLGNQFINLVKNSSLLGVIAGMDLMYHADIISTNTFKTFETYILVAVFYLTITVPLSILVNWLERRLKHA
ncbi:glutamine ABC transporter permease [Aneurinibacillus migulanus]|jgi:putative glutamine transport system permease protein|uniref:Amino acid ABC transporter membrane protein 1, PAAT family (TC 3.A.1.3.-) n=1 Tax=Aneurinibacillus migulanus TaxID=47500 RepID=A0A0D1XYE8_ANEMI|nr:amino acid ABC transporter permease [Aneurinibacillus migulanus]KIV51095.1 glutamine ABC transporter permease [Aneurinibacillus migulanus]KIV57078.1 glutamine ABC transporter permease [Aneurinibacillus migulanus]KON93256.1 glutamine ABC transporter permease [Aneurinibacillus migulanus]KPD09437.1 glutamine ABC transporter permease [Aneurinibacillus migulanus]MCP1356791.1 amino acid ABC transporter permease [Aneurinibacillus migulanus]